MIIFVDDEPTLIAYYVEEARRRGHDSCVLTSIDEVNEFLQHPRVAPDSIVVDVMFPGDSGIPSRLTGNGMRAGMPLFASLRAAFPDCHIVVLTSCPDPSVLAFFREQRSCTVLLKPETPPAALGDALFGPQSKSGPELERKLSACPPGRSHAKEYESILVDILRYLFVPPLNSVIAQSRRLDGRTIRDAIMPNDALSFFWASLRQELDARYIVAEFKNYSDHVGKSDILQLRDYLGRKTIGRFGLLVSRLSPSGAALQARRDAYSDQECMILFVHDEVLSEMIHLKMVGRDPSTILQELKREFELGY